MRGKKSSKSKISKNDEEFSKNSDTEPESYPENASEVSSSKIPENDVVWSENSKEKEKEGKYCKIREVSLLETKV